MKYFFGLDKWNILVQFYKYLILKSKEITDKIVTNCGFCYIMIIRKENFSQYYLVLHPLEIEVWDYI